MDLFEFLLGSTILTVVIGPPLVIILLFLYYRRDFRKHHRLDFEDKRLVSFSGIITQRPYFFNLFLSYLIFKSPNIYQSIMFPEVEGVALQVAPFVTLAMLASHFVNISLSIRRLRDVTASELKKSTIVILAFLNIIPIVNIVGLLFLGFRKRKQANEAHPLHGDI